MTALQQPGQTERALQGVFEIMVARVNGLILATVNLKDFAWYKDLRIEDWSR